MRAPAPPRAQVGLSLGSSWWCRVAAACVRARRPVVLGSFGLKLWAMIASARGRELGAVCREAHSMIFARASVAAVGRTWLILAQSIRSMSMCMSRPLKPPPLYEIATQPNTLYTIHTSELSGTLQTQSICGVKMDASVTSNPTGRTHPRSTPN